MANLECNAVCGVAITHHFLAKMVSAALTELPHGFVRQRLHPVSSLTVVEPATGGCMVQDPPSLQRQWLALRQCSGEGADMRCAHARRCRKSSGAA